MSSGDSGVLYEVWPGAEVDDLGDLSTLNQDAEGYSANVLLDATVTNTTLEQGSNFVGRMSGWLRAPRSGQFALTLKSAGKAQLTLGTSPENMESVSGWRSVTPARNTEQTDFPSGEG